MYVCEHFDIRELVPPEVYELVEDEEFLWLLFDSDALYVLDCLREDFGVCYVNTWKWGGPRKLSGFRPWNPDDEFALLSQHRFGRAFDPKFRYTAAAQVRKKILDVEKEYMKKIQGVELGVSWVHFDVRNNVGGELVTFRP